MPHALPTHTNLTLIATPAFALDSIHPRPRHNGFNCAFLPLHVQGLSDTSTGTNLFIKPTVNVQSTRIVVAEQGMMDHVISGGKGSGQRWRAVLVMCGQCQWWCVKGEALMAELFNTHGRCCRSLRIGRWGSIPKVSTCQQKSSAQNHVAQLAQ